MLRFPVFALILGLVCPATGRAGDHAVQHTAEFRAVAYLTQHVPRWHAENRCYSCHHNGDAVRALYVARRSMREIETTAFAPTNTWLAHPKRWKDNRGDERFSDKTLATLQFAAALAEAVDAGVIEDDGGLRMAAKMMADLQQPDGSWKLAGPATIGDPTTWGQPLATAMARRVLVTADRRAFRNSIDRAETWLTETKVQTVLDAAAVVIGLEGCDGDAASEQRARCLTIIRRGESHTGGWGPYVNSSPEPFDTAVVLLGLATIDAAAKDIAEMRQRGRASLLAGQLKDGSWIETTRPPGGTSYPQRLSTTGWALEALLSTRRSD